MEYNIPKTWKEITLKQFLFVIELERKQKDKEISDLEFTTEIFKLFTGLSTAEIESLSLVDLEIIGYRISTLLSSKIPVADTNKVSVDGNIYILDPSINTNNVKVVKEFIQLCDLTEAEMWENALNIIPIIAKPITTYSELVIKGRQRFGAKVEESDYKIAKNKKIKHPEDMDMVSANTVLTIFAIMKNEYKSQMNELVQAK